MSKKNLGYFHTAVPAGALAAAVPYLSAKKKDGESDEQFKARRRGLTAALGVAGAVAGGHFIPPMLLKSAGYFDKERERSKADLKSKRQDAKRMATMFTSKEDAEARAKRRVQRRKEGFTESSLIGRGALGLSGAGLLAKNIPLLGGAKGSQMLYHGTGQRGIQGILGEDADKGGMRLEYAGTKGRLNSALMPNAVVRQILEEEGQAVSDVELASIQTRLANRIQNNQGKPIVELVKEEMGKIGKDYGMPDAAVKRLQGGIKERLREAGMRIYFANSPEKVVTWHDDANELEKMKKGFQDAGFDGGSTAKNQLKSQLKMYQIMGDVSTGGIIGAGRDAKKQHDYMRNLEVHPQKVSREFIRDLAAQGYESEMTPSEREAYNIQRMVNPDLPELPQSRKVRRDFAHVLGTNVPTADVEELADFKGIKTPLRLSTGLQGALGHIPGFEGYDPSRDISTGLDIAQENIKHVDLVNPESGQATRYFLDSYRAPKLTGKQRLKSLGRAAVPLGLAGVGADMIYRSVSGRKGALGTLLSKYRKRKEEKGSTKTASKKHRPYLTAAKNIGKYGVPAVGLGLGMNVAFDAIGRKVVPVTEAEYAPTNLDDEIEGVAREAVRGTGGAALKQGVSFGLSALGAAAGRKFMSRSIRKRLPELAAAAKAGDTQAQQTLKNISTLPEHIGTAMGGAAPGLAGIAGMFPYIKYRRAARGQDTTRAELGETPEEQMKTPWKSAVLPTLATLAVSGGVLASGAKYFPGLIRRGELSALASTPSLSPSATRKHLEVALSNANKRGRAIPSEIQALARGVGNDRILNQPEHQRIRELAAEVKQIAQGRRRD